MNQASRLIDELKSQEKKGFRGFLRKITKSDEDHGLRKDIKEAFFHIQNALKITGEFKVLDEVDHIIVAGMGTNGIAGDLLQNYGKDLTHDLTVVRDGQIPTFVDKKSLVFIVSYTGNDHETVEAFRAASKKGAKIVGITSGGRLKRAFEHSSKEHVTVPGGLEETYTLPYVFFPMLRILENSGFIKDQKEVIEDTILALKKPIYENLAKEISEHLKEKIPIIYTSTKLRSVGERWKQMFNIIGKMHAFHGLFSDAAHNEINAYTTHFGEFHCIFLIDESDDDYVTKTMRTAKDILKHRNISCTEIVIRGSNTLSKFFSAMYIGDWAAFNVASEYQAGSADEDVLTKFQKKMKE